MAVISRDLILRLERLERQRPIIERQPPALPQDAERIRTVLAMLVEAGVFLPPGPSVGSPLHAVYLRLVEDGVFPPYGTVISQPEPEERQQQLPTAEAAVGFTTTIPA